MVERRSQYPLLLLLMITYFHYQSPIPTLTLCLNIFQSSLKLRKHSESTTPNHLVASFLDGVLSKSESLHSSENPISTHPLVFSFANRLQS